MQRGANRRAYGRSPLVAPPSFLMDFIIGGGSINPIIGGGTTTVTRALNTATRVNASGLIETVNANLPRFDYDPVTLALKGLLIEESRVNECLQSRDHTQAAWTKTTMTAALDQTGADGVANSASSLTATAGNATTLQAIVSAANVVRAFSASVKRITGSGGIDITIDNGATWTSITSSINSSTFTRVSRVQTLANPTVGFRIQTNGDKIAVDFDQEETAVSDSQPSSPTTATAGATVTRNLDNISLALGAWYSATEGTFFTEYIPMAVGASVTVAQVPFTVYDGTANNVMSPYIPGGAAALKWFVNTGGVPQVDIPSGTATANTIAREALNYKAADFAVSGNGAATVAQASGTVPTVTTLQLGQQAGALLLNGWLRKIAYITPKIPNDQLPMLSA